MRNINFWLDTLNDEMVGEIFDVKIKNCLSCPAHHSCHHYGDKMFCKSELYRWLLAEHNGYDDGEMEQIDDLLEMDEWKDNIKWHDLRKDENDLPKRKSWDSGRTFEMVSEEVLAFTAGIPGNNYEILRYNYHKKNWGRMFDNSLDNIEVVAWMPLPKGKKYVKKKGEER